MVDGETILRGAASELTTVRLSHQGEEERRGERGGGRGTRGKGWEQRQDVCAREQFVYVGRGEAARRSCFRRAGVLEDFFFGGSDKHRGAALGVGLACALGAGDGEGNARP